MAARDSLHQQRDDGGELVTSPFAAKAAHLPLLPYEKQLIDLLGCSEDEYRYFKSEAERRGKTRPAAYDHIPDVKNDALTVAIISLVVGVASTAASLLLTPKPGQAQQEEQKQNRAITLGSSTGPARFNSTYGFDGTAGIATWGEPIAIPFGKYTGKSGGLLITPKLVWSRLFSLGNQQLIKALYACGEWGMGFPNIEGIFLGNAPLDHAYKHIYAIYFRQGQGNNRIQGSDLRYGTRGTPDSGDPESFPDVFSCPTSDGENDEGFSYAYTPSNNTQFGQFQSVANGTALRAMWRVISITSEVSADQKGKLVRDRVKICGEDWGGMEGVGREYARGMGIVAINGQEYGERTDVVASVDDIATFLIAAVTIPDLYEKETYGVTVEDLNATLEGERAVADDLLQLGETIQIGRTSWRVIERSVPQWEINTEQVIKLRCIEQFGAPAITVTPRSIVANFANVNDGQDFGPSNHVGLASTCLARQAFGIVKTVRASDVVEIGIKSQVWNQAQNMMNWVEVPEPQQLTSWDYGNVQVSSGTLNKYLLRTSAFTVKVRPGGQHPDTGADYPWAPIGEQFCIRGRQPVDQFNFLRFYLPEQRKFEFRFEPLPAAIIIKAFQPDELFLHLDAKSNNLVTKSYDTPYGPIRMATAGEWVAQDDLIGNPETGYVDLNVDSDYEVVGNGVNQVLIDRYETREYNDSHGKAHGWRSEILGFPQFYQNQTKTAVVRCLRSNGKNGWVDVQITCTCMPTGGSLVTPPGYTPALYTAWMWGPPSYTVVGSGGTGSGGFPPVQDDWEILEELYCEVPITRDAASKNNKWLHRAYTEGARFVRMICTVQNIGDITVILPPRDNSRAFIPASQISEVTFYPGSWTTSADSNPEHQISYVNEIRANEPVIPSYFNMSVFGLSLRSGKNFTRLDQLRFWTPGGIQVYRHLTKDVGRSNLFSDFVYWLLTDKDAGTGDLVSEELVDKDSFERTARFLETNKIYCDTVLQDAVNLRQYISDTAKLMLCNFTIIDGKFGLEPALPVNSAGELSFDPVPIAMIFSEGNIIEGSFALDYLEYQQRADFKAVATYRLAGAPGVDEYSGVPTGLPEDTNVIVRYESERGGKDSVEVFDMATFCTQREQAILVCKYLLALRRLVRYTVKFQTVPEGISLRPGDFIRVLTQANPYDPFANGVVLADSGQLVTPQPLGDGTYTINYYKPGAEDVASASMQVVDGRVVDPALQGIVFSIPRAVTTESSVFQIQQLTLTEEGLVDVVAVEHPCDSQLRSLIVKDLLDDQIWYISE